MKRVVLFLALLLFAACETPHPEITITLESDFSEVIAAIRQSNQSLADKLALIEASVRDGMADNEAAMKLIETAVSSLNGSMSEKLAAIEAALSAQTTSLETKLSLIEAAVAAGFADGQAQQDLLRTALESLGGSVEDKLSAIEEAIGSQTTSLMAKLGLIETAVKNGLADEKKELGLISLALGTLDGDVKDKLDALERAMTSQTSGLDTKLGTIAKAVEDGFVDEGKALDLVQQALGTLKDSVDGVDFTLSSLQGKYVVIDFWGSWCKWCIKGFPDMKTAYAKHKGKVEFVGIACRDTEEKWKAATAKYELPWISVLNPAANDLVKVYEVKGFPTKIIVDPKGNIVKIILGEDPAFYTYLDSILK